LPMAEARADLADLLLVRHRRLHRAHHCHAAYGGPRCGGYAGGADGRPLDSPPRHRGPESAEVSLRRSIEVFVKVVLSGNPRLKRFRSQRRLVPVFLDALPSRRLES
jgi:hypothetical protein